MKVHQVGNRRTIWWVSNPCSAGDSHTPEHILGFSAGFLTRLTGCLPLLLRQNEMMWGNRLNGWAPCLLNQQSGATRTQVTCSHVTWLQVRCLRFSLGVWSMTIINCVCVCVYLLQEAATFAKELGFEVS